MRQAETASLYDDVRIWLNAEDANPAEDLRAILQELGLRDARVGVEYATYGLTAANGRLIEAALGEFCKLEDASDIVRRQRLVKSEAELAMVREAGRLARRGGSRSGRGRRSGRHGKRAERSGAHGNAARRRRFPREALWFNTGPRALFGRGIGGPRRIEDDDQVMIELAGSYCRYHVCVESTVAVGRPDPRQAGMMTVAADALDQIRDAARPGGGAWYAGRNSPQGAGRGRFRDRTLCCMRLRAGLHVQTHLDGRAANDLQRKSVGNGTWHGVLRAHHDSGYANGRHGGKSARHSRSAKTAR